MAKIEQKSINNIKSPFEGPFKDKYAGRSPERILCLYSVRLVFLCSRSIVDCLFIASLWSEIEKNTDKITIQSFTVPRAREWAKWASERTSERSGGRERSEQSGASERVSGASERANGRASGPVLTSRFLADLNHSALYNYVKNIYRGLGKWRVVYTKKDMKCSG